MTYRPTDRLDLSIAVPVISTTLSLLSNATIERVGTGTNTHTHYFIDPSAFEGRGSTHQFYTAGSATGIGDILVRAKGTLMKEGGRALAAGVDIRVPSGDEENLLGSGAAGLRPFAAYSGSFRAMAPHVNVAYLWNGKSLLAGDVATRRKADLPDQFVYAVGTDLSVNRKFSLVLDLLGQRIINSPRISTFPFMATGPFGSVACRTSRSARVVLDEQRLGRREGEPRAAAADQLQHALRAQQQRSDGSSDAADRR